MNQVQDAAMDPDLKNQLGWLARELGGVMQRAVEAGLCAPDKSNGCIGFNSVIRVGNTALDINFVRPGLPMIIFNAELTVRPDKPSWWQRLKTFLRGAFTIRWGIA